MNSAFRRVIKLQRQILKTIRADVRKAIGAQSRDLKRYYEAYKREFRGATRHSSKEELLKECLKADVILLGDYHTFGQSQKAALRLLRDLVNWETPLVLALEMVPSEHQPALNQYLSGKLTEKQFLDAMDYGANWGFPWENFRALLEFAREHQIAVLALNFDSERLDLRDAHAAEILANCTQFTPKSKLFVLYGDLHLARGHIPKFLKAELKQRALKRKLLTIFQNSESLYWKLAEQRMVHAVDVLALGRGRYCIMNAAPWVKLQSYLEWAEASQLLDAEDAADLNLHEITHERLKNLAEALKIELPENLDFTVQTINDLSFLGSSKISSAVLAELNRSELKAVKYHILGNRNIFIPGANLIYLASASVNSVSEGAAMLMHSALSGMRTIFYNPGEHFYAAVLGSTVSYFGSKILNHKRKCDLEDDFRLLLERKAGRGALPQEKLQRRVAKLLLRHCHAQREYLRQEGKNKRYRAPLSVRGPGGTPVFFETARCLGAILGEKLYASYVGGRYSAAKVEKLFKAELNQTRRAKEIYLNLVSDLERAPLGHTSKLDLF